MKNNLLPIAKEGLKYIGSLSGLVILFYIFDLEILSSLSFIGLLFFIFVFRNPERELPIFEEKSALSPVDGIVLGIDDLEDKEYGFKVTINSNYLDVAILRAPISGKVVSSRKQNGARLNLSDDLGMKINERTSMVFEDLNGNKVKVFHILKQSFCGMKTDSIETKNIMQSSRYGVMVYGITEVYLPRNFRLNIKLEEELHASQTLLGYFS